VPDPLFIVIAHPARKRAAEALISVLKADSSWDTDGSGCEANHRRAWEWAADQDDPDRWVVFVEDDVALVRGFIGQVRRALAVAPSELVSFYLGRGRPPHWQLPIAKAITTLPGPDVCWLSAPELFSAQCYAMPVHRARGLARTHRRSMPCDEHISRWARNRRLRVCYSWPSLVDHREDMVPLITERADGQPRIERRVAWNVGIRGRWTSRTHPIRTHAELGVTVVRKAPA